MPKSRDRVTASERDSDRQVLVRYGGIPLREQECAAETWEWDALTGWMQLDVEPPPACDHAKLAFDAAHGVMLLAGGGDANHELISGTWAWDGETWERIATDGPPPRAHFGFVHDAGHERTLLFGGYDGSRVFDDLWSWDGSVWEEADLEDADPLTWTDEFRPAGRSKRHRIPSVRATDGGEHGEPPGHRGQ